MATVTGLTAEATQDLFDAAKDRSNHTGTQNVATLSDFTESVQDLLSTTLVAGTNITLTYNDSAGTLTVSSSGGGGGSSNDIKLSTYTNGAGTAAANTTGFQNAVNAALAAGKPLVNDLGDIDIQINNRINMIGDFFEFHANGLRLVQTVNTAAAVRVGGEGQLIDGLRTYHSGNPTSADTAANGMEFGNCLLSTYSRIVIQNAARGFFMIQEIPTNGDQASNTVFSCNFENIRITGYAISGLDMRTYIAGMAASTGNSWDNVYIHNNWFGASGSPSSWPVIFRGFDESVFNQFNVEWCKPVGDAIFIQECRNMLFNSLHFEGIELTGNSALFRPYYDVRVTIHSFFSKSTVILDNAGRKSLFRGYSGDGNPCSMDVTSVRVRNTSNPGSRQFSLMEVESGCTGGDFTFRKVDVDQFNGGIVQDNTTVVPSQIESYNDVRLRNFSAPNIPIDLVRTTASAAIANTTLVTDTTLQFATTPGTYLIEGELYYTVPMAADLKFRFNHAAAATGKFMTEGISIGAMAESSQTQNRWLACLVNTDYQAGGVDSTELALRFQGTLIVTTAGTFAVQYAEAAASGNLIVGTHSRLSYRKRS